jgi:hypothetical protein
MKEQGIDRLISLLLKDSSGEIENVTRPANADDTISITFKGGEVLVLTAEEDAGENPV